MSKPHKCPKCNGTGWLQYDPQMPFSNSTSCGPWQCDVCRSGIIWSYDPIEPKALQGSEVNGGLK